MTQPYDKISSEMQARYLALSPYNLVRIILGERFAADDDRNNVYTRASAYFDDWIRNSILARDSEPAFYAYFQRFRVPDSTEEFVRKGFIGLGPVEDYSAGIVHRHEQTLAGPKKDRLELLNHTHAHFGQIFMLYPDRELIIERMLDRAAEGEPLALVEDEYCTTHSLWRIADPGLIGAIQAAMEPKKLLIADGHHRYETALTFRKSNPQIEGARRVMMTFVNMHSPGLRILATHRVVRGLPSFRVADFLAQVPASPVGGLEELKVEFAKPAQERVRIAIAIGGEDEVRLFDRPRGAGELDVAVLHEELLRRALGISEEEVREERYLEYVRGLDAAYEKVRSGAAQIAFLLEPTTIEQVSDVAFRGGVMPQKSTDFFPKLLSGFTIYKVE